MNTPLDRVAAKARKDRRVRFTSLAHVLTPEDVPRIPWKS
jgi:hypothetical protein